MTSRIDEILAIIELAPDDPFPRYGLAMEYKAQGRIEEARAAFQELAGRHPDYLPQYLMHGNLLAELRERDAARKAFDKGIEVAQRQRNHHALGELRSALAALDGDGSEDDEDT